MWKESYRYIGRVINSERKFEFLGDRFWLDFQSYYFMIFKQLWCKFFTKTYFCSRPLKIFFCSLYSGEPVVWIRIENFMANQHLLYFE